MANDVIETYASIEGREANYQDRIFDATALPNATTATTSAFLFGKAQARCEIVVYANTDIVVADGETLSFDILYGESYGTSKNLAAFAPSGASQTIVEGAEVFRYTADSDVEQSCKISTTSSANLIAASVNGNIYYNA